MSPSTNGGWEDVPEAEREALEAWEATQPRTAEEWAARANARIAAECEAHAATCHRTCPSGHVNCLWWSEQEGDPDVRCAICWQPLEPAG